jgi:hypothetical protein
MSLDRIPAELRALPQWVVWPYEEPGGKRTKVPYKAAATDAWASTADPATWASFDTARGGAEGRQRRRHRVRVRALRPVRRDRPRRPRSPARCVQSPSSRSRSAPWTGSVAATTSPIPRTSCSPTTSAGTSTPTRCAAATTPRSSVQDCGDSPSMRCATASAPSPSGRSRCQTCRRCSGTPTSPPPCATSTTAPAPTTPRSCRRRSGVTPYSRSYPEPAKLRDTQRHGKHAVEPSATPAD